jgi:ornithine--oxo-acid transaminase
LLAEEHEGIEADLTLIGKALSGGFYPVSAVLSNIEILEPLKPGQHGSTFGGNPLACAVARTALKVLLDEGMIENAREMGAYFFEKLQTIENENIKEIRGRGLMIAIELHAGTDGGARKVAEKLKTLGILCKETHTDTLRFAPPLVITKEDVDWAFEKIEQAFGA